MPTLTPVDYDPFAAQGPQEDFLSTMVRAKGGDPAAMAGEAPTQPKLTPVDYDPFAQAPAESESPKQEVLPPEMPKPSMAESAVRGYVHGGSLGFGDEAMGAIGAAPLWLAGKADKYLGTSMVPEEFQDRSFGDIYREGRGIARGQEAAAREANPWTYGLSEVGGGVMTGAKLPLPKVSQGATALGRVGNAAAGGAAGGAAYGLGESEADLTKGEVGQAALDTAKGATIGAVTGALLQGGLEKFARSRVPTPKADEVKAMASQMYDDAAQKGGVLTKKFTNNFLREALKMRHQTKEARLVAGDDAGTALLKRMTSLKDRPLSLKAAQEIDEIFGNMVDDMIRPNGQMTKEGRKILELQSTFRNMIESAPANQVTGGKAGFQSLKEARKLWAASAKLRDIEKIITRAEMMEVPSTGIKTGFRTLASNPKRMRGYTPEERKLILRASKRGLPGEILNLVGSRLNTIAAGATGGVGPGAAMFGISTAARGAAGKMQAGRADAVTRKIVEGALGKTAPNVPQVANYGKGLRNMTGIPKEMAFPLIAGGSAIESDTLLRPKRSP